MKRCVNVTASTSLYLLSVEEGKGKEKLKEEKGGRKKEVRAKDHPSHPYSISSRVRKKKKRKKKKERKEERKENLGAADLFFP